jgi:NTE family protein
MEQHENTVLVLQGGGALRGDADFKALASIARPARRITIAHLINRRLPTSIHAKDYEFSRATVRQLWEAGRADARRAHARGEWHETRQLASGIRVFDVAGHIALAA